MTLRRKSTSSLQYTSRRSTTEVYFASISLYSVFELTRNAFNWSVFRSTNSFLSTLRYDSSPCLSSSSVSLLLQSFFFFCPPSPSSESVPRISREREREKEQYRKRTEKKMRKSQSNIKKKETQFREKNEQWNAREKGERTCLLPHSNRKTFWRKGFSFSYPPCNIISVSERCAIRCSFQQRH